MNIVFSGYDNGVRVRISEIVEGFKEPLDFEGASSVELYLPDLDITIDSGIDFSEGGGVLTMQLGHASVPKGRHSARLLVYDPLHPNGQVLVHEHVHKFEILVV